VERAYTIASFIYPMK